MSSSSNSSSTWTWFVVIALGGLVTAGLSVFREGRKALEHAPVPSPASVDEAAIVERVLSEQSKQLPSDPFALGHQERALLLKQNGELPRKFEVAGGLLAIAQKHLEMENPTEAVRVAQICADLVSDSVTAARCWILCGEASAFSQPALPLPLRYLERADQVLSRRLAKNSADAPALKLRAGLLLQLGQTEARFQRLDEAEKHLRELTADGPLAPHVTAESRLQALLTLSSILSQPAPTEESERLRQAAWQLGMSDAVSPSIALHALRSSIPPSVRESAALFAPPSPDTVAIPTRQESLSQLWNGKRFQGLPDWFAIGDELASDHYFHEPRQNADFEIVCRQLLVALPPVLKQLSSDSADKEELESIFASNLLLATQSAQERGDQSEVTRLTQLFETTFSGRDISFSAPAERPAQRLHRIGEIYRTRMLGHIEQMRQLQNSPRVPEPR